MGNLMDDEELRGYKELIGNKEFRRQYQRLYQEAIQCPKRYSEKEYTNSPEKLKAIREKYKKGVTDKTVKEMLDKLIG